VVEKGSPGERRAYARFQQGTKGFGGLRCYWIVDVEGPEQAYKIAARASAAPGPDGKVGYMAIEVRQVLGGFADLGL